MALLAALAVLALGMPEDATAQTEVPADWALKPADIAAGEQFRLMFVTSTTRDATSTNIADYNTVVSNRAMAGVTAMRTYANDFTALVSTQTVNARANTLTRNTDTDAPIYWVRSGTVSANNRVADDYADFYDGTWQNSANARTESGAFQGWFTSRLWTGTNTNGTTHATRFMGASTTIRWRIQSGSITADHSTPSGSHNILALSPVFQVATTNNPPTAAHNTVTTVVDRPYTFEADDFGFVDTDTGDTLASVKIVTLPAVGTLAFDGTPVMQNDVVIWDDIEDDKLTFTPVAGASGTGYATFTFKVNDGTVDSASAYTMTIDVTDAPALACAAPDLAGRDRIWTGELTVGMVTIVAPTVGYGFFSNGPAGALDETMFNIGRNGYVVDSVSVIDGDLSFNLTSRSLRDAEVDALRLHVCDTPFDFSDAVRSRSNNLYRWNDNLDWSSLSSRTLYLSLPEGYPEPPALRPGAPTGLSAQSVSGKPGYLRLSWTPGSAPGGSLPPIVTDYEARYRKTGTTKWSPEWSFRDYGTPGFPYPPGSPVAPRGGNDAPLIYYLDPNTEYQVQVRATNSYGESGWSNQVSATTAQATTANDDGTADADNGNGLAAAPSQPTVRRVANEPGLMVRWNAPRTASIPTGYTFLDYEVEVEKERERNRRITTLSKRYLYVVETVDGGTTPPVTYLLIPKLEPNTTYTVRVRAVYHSFLALTEGSELRYSPWSPDTSGTTAAGRGNNIQLSVEFSDGTRSTTVAPGAEVDYRVKATGIHDWAAVRARGGIGKAQIRIWEHGRHHRRAGYYQSTKGITYRHFINETGSSGYLEGKFTVPDEAGAGASGTIEIHLIPPSSRCGGTGTGARCPVGSTVGSVNRSTNKLCIAVERSGDIEHPCSGGQTQVEAPTIEGTPRLSASGGDGAWTPGETVEATVTFSEAVTVDGTPTIGLMLGGTQKQSASYRSGSGTRELVFAYTLSENDGSHTAMGVALDSLTLNGGSITSEATGADAELSHDGTIITGTRDGGRGVRELPGPTAQFSEVPATHDGATAFEVTLRFSEAPGLDEGTVRGALEVSCASESCATVTGASRVTDREWTVTVEPSQAYAITLRLPARACGETGAVCIGGRALAGPASATIPGRALTATLTHMPDEGDVKGEHKGSGTFEVRLVFNTEPDVSYKTVRDTMFDVTGGTITGARRVTRGNNQRFDIVVKPRGNDAMTFSLHSPLPACGETGSVCTEAGRMVEGPVSATILGPVAISVADATVREEEGATLAFAVTLDREREADVTVDYATSNGTATAGEDYVAQSGDLTFAAGETAKTIEVEVLDDIHDEGTETMTLTLSNPSGARIAHASATGSIENSDPMPKAWMVRFGRTVGSQVVDALTARLEGGRGSHLTVAGIPLMGTTAKEPEAQDDDPFALPEWATSSAREAESHTVSLDDLLLRSTFHLRSGGEEGAGPAFTTWGRVATGGFEADVDDVTMDGDVTTGMIGFDAEWERLLAGIMLSQSTGDGSYRLDPGKRTDGGTDGGTVESDLTGVYPYARIDINERVSAWGLAGAGSGTITLKRDAGKAMKTDLSMRMGALGVKGQVLDGSGPSRIGLNVKSDAMWVGTKSERTNDMVATEGDVTRVRLIVQGERVFVADNGATFTPSAEVGLRHDGGDAETGSGVEVGGGLRYIAGPLTIEGQVRMLVAHEESGYEEWGASGAIRMTPSASGRGLTLSIAPAWGRTGSATQRLWSAHDARGLGADNEFEAAGQLAMDAGYGFGLAHRRGVLTPYAGVTLGNAGARTMRTGARWQLSRDTVVSVEATREANAGEADNHLKLRAALRF